MSENKNTKSLSKRKIELKAIGEWIADGERVLDLGCGSGILSIAALRLGLPRRHHGFALRL